MSERTRYDYLEIGDGPPKRFRDEPAAPPVHTLDAVEVIGGPGTPAAFNCPGGVAVDRRDSVYVADSLNHRIVKITATGDVFLIGARGPNIGDLLNPQGIAVDNLGFMYVVELGNSRVSKISPRGDVLCTFGFRGHQIGQLDRPCDISRDPVNNLYVADTGNDRVQVFDANGQFVAVFGASATTTLRSPQGVAVNRQGCVFVADGMNRRIVAFSPAGEEIGYIPAEGELYGPQAVTIAPDGLVLVAERDADRIRGFTPEGEEVCVFAPTTRASHLNSPTGIAAGPDGSVYVADTMNHRLLRLKYT